MAAAGDRIGDGVLIDPGKSVHVCCGPDYEQVKQGAIWQCDCGTRWKLIGYDWHRLWSRRYFGRDVVTSDTHPAGMVQQWPNPCA